MTDSYNINEYKHPLFTVDSVLFTITDSALKVLLVKRANSPFEGSWGLPGGFVDIDSDSTTDITALRKLKEKTNVEPPYLEQLQTFSGAHRDPRGFSVTLVYFALIAAQNVSTHIKSIDDVQWVDINTIQDLSIAFDHKHLIEHAKQRLQQKTLYSMVPIYCLPEYFTVGQLKSVIEIILGKTIQRKSLIRRLESTNIVEKSDEKVSSGGRLAHLYTLKSGVDIVNFERNLSA
ncbi:MULTISPECIES: NUDIX hydrolase [Pseudoalteromonas]|uniref:NUDIX hydrolase n=1 Tax=Pseudoalteromonas porphyrae TaxID=187330 RepID=A0A0N0M292_9GAMM|nr:NUDIX hydrolase [Pseudoalteromonas porphyrae]KPH65519.1 NUDIX hydrolase [Pseudoalteromonas porphyrae]